MSSRDAEEQVGQGTSSEDVEKALAWFNALHKCALLLEMPDDQPIIEVPQVLAERLNSLEREPKHGVTIKTRHHTSGEIPSYSSPFPDIVVGFEPANGKAAAE